MVTALENDDLKVLTASNGVEGITVALENKPDLIFLDILMPESDGLDVLKQLREDDWGKTVPVVIMTVVDDLDNMAKVLEQGAIGYIIKSNITLENVVGKAKEVLGS
mgnify:FL=1